MMKSSCEVSIMGFETFAWVGVHPYERTAAQKIVIDARLGYAGVASFTTRYIDYDEFCTKLEDLLREKPHTELLETLAIDIALWSFNEFSMLSTFSISICKPKIRSNADRVAVDLMWTRELCQKVRSQMSYKS